MNREEVKERQRLLQRGHFYGGKIDGIWGPKSRDAFFQYSDYVEKECRIGADIPKPRNRKELEQLFGHIEYTDKPNGWITIGRKTSTARR